MSRRRSHSRYRIASEGVLRVLRDVAVLHGNGEDVTVISGEAAIPGEVMTIEHVDREGISVLVRVVESRPVMVDGSVRHQLRLRPLGETSARVTGRATERR